MCLERIFRNAGFAIAALAIVGSLAIAIEYQPLLFALSR